MSRLDRADTLPWMAAGTTFFLGHVGQLPDHGFGEPSALPGWTRAHVVAHVTRNADALGHLLAWARTGVETPMYASADQRAADIEAGARLSAEKLRKDGAEAAGRLDEAVTSLPEAAWRAEVRSALGRRLPAEGVPWMRVREVWLHAVDLRTGASLRDVPDDVVTELLEDVTGMLAGREDAPAMQLTASDLNVSWTTGPDSSIAITGEAVDLLGWLTGRTSGERLHRPGPLPELPPWL